MRGAAVLLCRGRCCPFCARVGGRQVSSTMFNCGPSVQSCTLACAAIPDVWRLCCCCYFLRARTRLVGIAFWLVGVAVLSFFHEQFCLGLALVMNRGPVIVAFSLYR